VFRRLLVASRALRRSGACGYFSSQPRERRNLFVAVSLSTPSVRQANSFPHLLLDQLHSGAQLKVPSIYLFYHSKNYLSWLSSLPAPLRCVALLVACGPFSSHPSAQVFRTSSSHVAKFSNPLSINTLHLSITWPFLCVQVCYYRASYTLF
jgi:hypothetical protein